MRPYLAVIRDSFREAIASRVLWIVLVLIALLLLAIAPLGYQQRLSTGFSREDVLDWPLLVTALREANGMSRASPTRRVWQLLNREARQAVLDFEPLPERPTIAEATRFESRIGDIEDGLRGVISDADLYQQAVWQETIIGEEAARLTEQAELGDEQRQRLNRLLVEAAFPGLVRRSPPTSLQLRYLIWEFGPPIPVSKETLASRLRSSLPWLIDKGLLSIGLFVAILVTASIIPQTFEAGSLHLLLSKPIARWMLFLSKFAGGCAFVLLCITFLFVGLWLVFGLRLGMWEHRLLLSIPLYVLVFAIYYSISALAGVVWRNAIVSVIVAILFWLVCFLVGITKGQLEGFLDNFRIVRVLEAGDAVISANQAQRVQQWNPQRGEWEQTLMLEGQEAVDWVVMLIPNLPPMLGPVYDAADDRLLAGQFSFDKGQVTLRVGTRSQNGQEAIETRPSSLAGPTWKTIEGPQLPALAKGLFVTPEGRILLRSQLGLYELRGDPTRPSPTLFGVALPWLGSQGFQKVALNPPLIIGNHADAAMDARSGELAIYSDGTVTLLEPITGGGFRRHHDRRLFDAEEKAATLALSGSTLVLALADGQVLVLDKESLEIRQRFRPENREPPRFVSAAPDGRWCAVVFHNGRLWMLDTQRMQMLLAEVDGQGDIAAISFSDENHLLVADGIRRVSRYKLGSLEQVEQYEPEIGFFEAAYRYGIVPLYTVFPKPGEMYKTVQYLLTDRETTAASNEREDLSAARERLRPWTPVWSSLAFMAVVLGITCIYIERQDF